MMSRNTEPDSVTQAYSAILSNLLGLKITMATHAASMRGFIFGPSTSAPDAGQWVMHIQCAWRIETGSAILTGSGDWYEPADLEAQMADDWDPAEGASLQETRLREIFHDHDLSKRTIWNNTASLICTEYQLEVHGGVTIELSGDYVLRLFPSGSRGEHWRIFQKGDTNTHVICEA
jgi:hypothetical protein